MGVGVFYERGIPVDAGVTLFQGLMRLKKSSGRLQGYLAPKKKPIPQGTL